MLAIGGLSLAAMGFVAMSPIFWTLPTEYMTGFAAAAGIGLINSLGNLGGFLAPILRDTSRRVRRQCRPVRPLRGRVRLCDPVRPDHFFKKANEVEAGHLDEVDSLAVTI